MSDVRPSKASMVFSPLAIELASAFVPPPLAGVDDEAEGVRHPYVA